MPPSGSLRLISSRTLYNQGILTQRSDSLAPLSAGPRARISAQLFEHLKLAPGESVRVHNSRGSVIAEAISDMGIPEGSVSLPFNLGDEGAPDLIDISEPVNFVEVERA